MSRPSADEVLAGPRDHLKNISPAIFTPMHEDGYPNLELMTEYVGQLAALEYTPPDGEAIRCCQSVAVCGSTGELPALTPDETLDVLAAAAEADRGDLLLVGGLAPEHGVEACKGIMAEMKELGYDAVLIRPGTDISGSGEVADSLQPLIEHARELNLPVVLYSIPVVSPEITLEELRKLKDGPGGEVVVGAKYSHPTLDSFRAHRRAYPDDTVYCGWDSIIPAALEEDGAATSGPAAGFAKLYAHMLCAVERGDTDEVRRCEKTIQTLFDAMKEDPADAAELPRMGIEKLVLGLGTSRLWPSTTEDGDRLVAAIEGLPEDHRALVAESLLVVGGHERWREQLKGYAPQAQRLPPIHPPEDTRRRREPS